MDPMGPYNIYIYAYVHVFIRTFSNSILTSLRTQLMLALGEIVVEIVQNSAVLHLTGPDLFKLGFQHVIGFVPRTIWFYMWPLINTMKEYGTYCTNQTWWVDKTPEIFAVILRNPFRIFGKILGHVHPLLRSFLDVWLFHMVTTSDGRISSNFGHQVFDDPKVGDTVFDEGKENLRSPLLLPISI